jgi:hypothetical protein
MPADTREEPLLFKKRVVSLPEDLIEVSVIEVPRELEEAIARNLERAQERARSAKAPQPATR